MGFNSSVLVTGAGGQVGRALARLVPSGTPLNRSELDISERDAVLNTLRRHRPEVLVNGAAYTNVDGAETDPETAFRVNAEAVSYLAEAANETGAVLVQISTDYVFDGNQDRAYVEEDPTDPLSVYGKSKLAGEKFAAEADQHLIIRTSWVFGEGHNFIRSILSAADTREELQVVDDQVGRPTYAVDLAQGIIGLVNVNARGLYHLTGSGAAGSWADIAQAALQVAGKSTKVRRVSTSEYYSGRSDPVAPRPANSTLDCKKAEALGVSLREWREAVAEYVKELK